MSAQPRFWLKVREAAWAKDENYPQLHGWVLDLHTGLMESIIEIMPGETDKIEEIYRYEFETPQEKDDLVKIMQARRL